MTELGLDAKSVPVSQREPDQRPPDRIGSGPISFAAPTAREQFSKLRLQPTCEASSSATATA